MKSKKMNCSGTRMLLKRKKRTITTKRNLRSPMSLTLISTKMYFTNPFGFFFFFLSFCNLTLTPLIQHFLQEPEPEEEEPNKYDADDRFLLSIFLPLPSLSFLSLMVLFVFERMHKKKRLVFPGKTLAVKKKKKKTLSKFEGSPKDEEHSGKAAEEQQDETGERMIRKSTRTSVIVRQAERDAIRAALQATIKVHSFSSHFSHCMWFPYRW